MNDRELCEAFGTSLEEVSRIVDAVEADDLSEFDFDKAMLGRPLIEEEMDTISLKIPHSRVEAMRRVAAEQGVSRSEFIRRAIDRELVISA